MAKILIIEDDPLVSRMYQKSLGFENLDVETASNGKEGVEKAKKIQPSLILCDVMMPKMNGMEVLEHLKADPTTKDIPIIMLTNLSGTHDAETAMSKGAFAYMVKSEYKPRDIAQTVKNTLSGGPAVQPSTMMNAAAGQAPVYTPSPTTGQSSVGAPTPVQPVTDTTPPPPPVNQPAPTSTVSPDSTASVQAVVDDAAQAVSPTIAPVSSPQTSVAVADDNNQPA